MTLTKHEFQVPVLRKAHNLSHTEVVAWLKQLRGQPYVAQSGFDVTSIFKLKAAGETYYAAGVNVENHDLTTGTCGEEGAIAAAISAMGGQIDIVEGWVMGAPKDAQTSDIACYPCGECRQRIAQYAAPDAPIHIIALNGELKDSKTRAELLPQAFSFRDLEHIAPSNTTPIVAAGQASERLYQLPEKPLTAEQIFHWLSALRGDVRVTGYNETTLWRLASGAYVAGVNIENAAYPSSTNVMASAAAVMNACFGRQAVEEVWMYGFYTEANQQTAHSGKYYIPSGVSLQILRQFAQHPNIQLHCFNSHAAIETTTLADALTIAHVFEG